jgi:hypothetical protein
MARSKAFQILRDVNVEGGEKLGPQEEHVYLSMVEVCKTADKGIGMREKVLEALEARHEVTPVTEAMEIKAVLSYWTPQLRNRGLIKMLNKTDYGIIYPAEAEASKEDKAKAKAEKAATKAAEKATRLEAKAKLRVERENKRAELAAEKAKVAAEKAKQAAKDAADKAAAIKKAATDKAKAAAK